ncbi:MAG TPA: hypothetical protein VK753_08895 [Xanthomonadaceae bacterium]|nr:hypothetical protein [Xanthomonadaceae bacterium]
MRISEAESVVMEMLWPRSPLAANEGTVSATRPPMPIRAVAFRVFTPPVLFCPGSIPHPSFARLRPLQDESTSEHGAFAVRKVKQAALRPAHISEASRGFDFQEDNR